jgi:hypothetical protein
MRRPPLSKIVEGKRHEMFKSRLQSRHWSCRLSARLVQQTSLLFKALPRCVRGRCAEATTKAERDLLRLALRTTGFTRTAEAGRSRHRGALRSGISIAPFGGLIASGWKTAGLMTRLFMDRIFGLDGRESYRELRLEPLSCPQRLSRGTAPHEPGYPRRKDRF